MGLTIANDHPCKPSELERDHILKEILDNIDRYADKFNLVDYDALKKDVLIPVIEKHFNPDTQLRGFLRAFRNTIAFKKAYNAISDPVLKKQINAFIEGKSSDEAVGTHGFQVAGHPSPATQKHFSLLDEIKNLLLSTIDLKAAIKDIFHPQHPHVKDLPVIWEDAKQTKKMPVVVANAEFDNWGQTVKNKPKLTFVPTTVLGVQNIVRYAASKNLRVRCGGYRHSWSSIFSQDNEILISLVDLRQVTTLPDPMSITPGEYNPNTVTELQTIELKEQLSDSKRLCRIGVGVTNESFRRWSLQNNAWALPVDVILVEVTIGGVNGPICHGAGLRHSTVSDLVRRIEYVDCKGDLRTVDDPHLIKAAAGSFGLLGVITHITFELDAMTYAVLEPRKVDIGLAIPPPTKEQIPVALRSKWFNEPDAADQLAKAKVEFERRAANDYYSEWFWFTYQRKAWVNTWNNTTDPTNAVDYPNDAQTFLQWVEGWLGGILTEIPLFNVLPGYWQTQLLATMGMAALPPTLGEHSEPTIKTAMPNALHFRRGIQNMRVRDMEFQIPLPPRKDNPTKPDFSIVQKAWWDVINLVYKEANDQKDPSSPMRLTLELRIMGGSNILMAPQRGNDLGTASIEVLTLPDAVTDNEWQGFMQQVADLWMSYGDDLNVRPHWAKEWESLKFKGQDAKKYLKTVAYPKQIAEFRAALQKIGEPYGWGLDDLRKRFSNQLWDQMIYE